MGKQGTRAVQPRLNGCVLHGAYDAEIAGRGVAPKSPFLLQPSLKQLQHVAVEHRKGEVLPAEKLMEAVAGGLIVARRARLPQR